MRQCRPKTDKKSSVEACVRVRGSSCESEQDYPWVGLPPCLAIILFGIVQY
jgi:hypothetical protein